MRTQNNLAQLVNDGPEENPAMVPLVEPRLKAKINALRNQVGDMQGHLTTLENIVKQQSALNKQQEARPSPRTVQIPRPERGENLHPQPLYIPPSLNQI